MTGGQPLGTVDVTEQAFRWVTYTPAAAILDLVSAGPGASGATVRASVQMRGRLGRRRLAGGRPARRRLGQLGRRAVLAGRVHRLPRPGR